MDINFLFKTLFEKHFDKAIAIKNKLITTSLKCRLDLIEQIGTRLNKPVVRAFNVPVTIVGINQELMRTDSITVFRIVSNSEELAEVVTVDYGKGKGGKVEKRVVATTHHLGQNYPHYIPANCAFMIDTSDKSRYAVIYLDDNPKETFRIV